MKVTYSINYQDGRSSDSRGNQLLSQRARTFKRQMMCRRDIDSFSVPFLSIYESLIPPEEEKLKQNQLLGLLEKLVCKEWPMARLYLYGSCASSFGVSKSDIDVCLAIQDADVDKSKIIMKLADILQSDNLQNVQVRSFIFPLKLFSYISLVCIYFHICFYLDAGRIISIW